jgi:hypothetical protein
MKNFILISLLALLMMDCKTSDGGALEIVEPTVEMRDNPEGIALLAPRFSW